MNTNSAITIIVIITIIIIIQIHNLEAYDQSDLYIGHKVLMTSYRQNLVQNTCYAQQC